MTKLKTAIYPFKKELLPLIRNVEKLNIGIKVTEVYSKLGKGILDQDIAYICNQPHIGIKVSPIDKFEYSDCEMVLLFIDSNILDEEIYKFIKIAIQKQMRIVFTSKTGVEKTDAKFNELISGYNQINFCTSITAEENIEDDKIPVNTPVVLVGGLVDEPDIKEIIIKLFLRFKEIGLRTSVVMKDELYSIIGYKDFENFYKSNDYESEKIDEIKRQLKKIEKLENPDIFIIEAPDPIIEYNDRIHNGYGILTYMLSKACILDLMICSVPFEFCNMEYIKCLENIILKKYDSKLIGVHINNVIIDSEDSLQKQKVSYIHADLSWIENSLNNITNYFKPRVFNVISDEIIDLSNDILKEFK